MKKVKITNHKGEKVEIDFSQVKRIETACICPARAAIVMEDDTYHIVKGTPDQAAADLGIDEGK